CRLDASEPRQLCRGTRVRWSDGSWRARCTEPACTTKRYANSALVEEAADPVASFHVGLIALRQKEWSGAVNAFMTAAPNIANKTSLLHNLAIAYDQLGQLEKARLVIERAITSGGSGDPLIQLEAAIIALRLADYQTAKVRLSEARSLWTANPPPAVWFHYAAQVASLTDDPDREM